jgi:hypothetical protein
MNKALPVVALVLGIALLVLSVAWSTLFPPTRTWTEEKSQRLAELGSETNRLKFAVVEARNRRSMHAGENPAEAQVAYDEARAEYDQLQIEFESARDTPKTAATALRWSGIGLVVLAAGFLVVGKNGG